MGDVTISKTSEIINLDTTKLLSDFKQIEKAMVDDESIYQTTTTYLEREYDKYAVDNIERIRQQSQLQAQLSLAHTAKAIDTALQMQQVASQLALSQAEIDFNKARTKLVEAQTETEQVKKIAAEREIQSFDDNLRVKEAENLTNAVFGYASGGVAVPTDMKTQMLNAIDAITPSDDSKDNTQKVVNNNLQSVQEHIDAKFETLNNTIITLNASVTNLSAIMTAIGDKLAPSEPTQG